MRSITMFEIETARLRLRQFIAGDLEDYARIYANSEYTRYSPKGAVPLEQAREASQAAYDMTTTHCFPSGYGKDWIAQKMPVFMV